MGVVISLAGGFIAAFLIFDYDIPTAIFFGTMLIATSIGVTVRTLSDVGKLNTTEGEILLSSAIFDDFFVLFLVLIFSSVLFPSGSDVWYLNLFLGQGHGFILAWYFTLLIDIAVMAILIVVVVILIPHVL